MIEIEKPNITTENLSVDGTSGTFIVEPLERGYGITLGNSLRRVLLSSLPGVAVTSIKIDGILHEFSTVPGVVEDVTEIVLNVKGITAKLHCPGPKTVVIDVTGDHDITAGDIKQDSDIEILNPGHHIATLSGNERFYMELVFDSGRGYVSQERNKQLDAQLRAGVSAPIGTIFTDSIYTPVYNVNYKVENTRAGNVTDFDKLTLEAKFQALSPGGAISYVEVPNMQDNLDAVLSVMQYIYENIMYAELNTKSDYCQECGFDGEIEVIKDDHGKLIWRCPKCGNTDQAKMNVARRTCGYIGTQYWNQGRTSEIKDRVLHL